VAPRFRLQSKPGEFFLPVFLKGEEISLHENVDRFPRDQQERAREDAHVDQRPDADTNHDRVGRREIHSADLAFRFFEIHIHDDPEVIVNGHHAVEYADDRQPVIPGVDGVAEDIKLAHEAGKGRDARQREQKNAHRQRNHRVSCRETRIGFDAGIGRLLPAQKDDDRKGPDVHKCVNQQIKEDARGENLVADGEGDQNVSGMGNAGIGEHPFDIVLHQRGDVSQGHRQDGDDP